jgi:hypothetical protein
MTEEREVKERILEAARERFYQFGFTKVTTDEIASDIGISKKTLYKHFPSKDHLLQEVIQSMLQECDCTLNAILSNEQLDFVEKLKQIMLHIGMQYAKINPACMEDLRKNVPQVWKTIDEYRHKKILTDFTRLCEEGVKNGVFRSDINYQIVVLMYANVIQKMINPEMLSQLPFSASQVFEVIVKVIFEGTLAEKARPKYFENQKPDESRPRSRRRRSS